MSLAGAACLVSGVVVVPLGLIHAFDPTVGPGGLDILGVAGLLLSVGVVFFYAGIRTLSSAGHLDLSAPVARRAKALLGVVGITIGLLVETGGATLAVIAAIMAGGGIPVFGILGLHPALVALIMILLGTVPISLGSMSLRLSEVLRIP